MFNEIGYDLMENSFAGYNACLFAYGQTSSGKSYSMMGTSDQPGIIPRLCNEVRLSRSHIRSFILFSSCRSSSESTKRPATRSRTRSKSRTWKFTTNGFAICSTQKSKKYVPVQIELEKISGRIKL